jgi:hypothetical protein
MHELMLTGLQRRHWIFTTALSEERFIDEPFFMCPSKNVGGIGENTRCLNSKPYSQQNYGQGVSLFLLVV